jgi:alpha-galactosidase/6-phospho-beta-glucosidase family protein
MEGYINKAAVLTAITKANKEAPMSYTHDEIIELMIEYIEKLPVEDINELKAEVADLNNRRHLIWALGVDYDGCNTVESLKELIDELVSYTQLPREQVPDITSRTSRWQFKKYVGEDYYFCASCGTEYKLPDTWSRYDVGCYCKYCSNCGAKMRSNE